MEERKEMSLIEKRAKLIEYQNQISWIVCEYDKLKDVRYHNKWTKAIAIALYENLNTIVKQINDECLCPSLSNEYRRMINGVLDDLKFYTEASKSVSETNFL